MRSTQRARSTTAAAGVAALIGGAAVLGATVGTATATTPPIAPCAIPAVAHTASAAPKLAFVNTTSPVGSVEIHAEGKLGKSGGEVTALGCLASGTNVGSVSYLIVRAPKSTRYYGFQVGDSHYNADGTATATEASIAPFTTEKAFDTAIKKAHMLTIAGLKGPVYVQGATTPLEILATKSGKKKTTAAAKQAAALAFLKQYTSPYAPQSK